MNLTNPEEQSLISGFLNESAPESERASLLAQLSKIDEPKTIELITLEMKKRPPISFMKAMVSLLPTMKCDQSHELMNYLVQYLLKPDAERIPRHTEQLAEALPIMAEFKRPEFVDVILSSYTCFSDKVKQNAIIKSGVFQKLLDGPLTDRQRAEILLITGETDKIPASISKEDFEIACHKIVSKHADLKKIMADLTSVKNRGEMELYQKLKEEAKGKLMPDAVGKAIVMAAIVLIVAFLIFYFGFLFNKDLSSAQIANKITGFAISAFCVLVGLGTLALVKYKNI
jgi:hypothetical protein